MDLTQNNNIFYNIADLPKKTAPYPIIFQILLDKNAFYSVSFDFYWDKISILCVNIPF